MSMTIEKAKAVPPNGWESEYWKLRLILYRASLWKLLRFWLTRNEEKLYGN